ncbi:hypothetical protein LSH36_58g06010, partial [Paralvinella palmiformis]
KLRAFLGDCIFKEQTDSSGMWQQCGYIKEAGTAVMLSHCTAEVSQQRRLAWKLCRGTHHWESQYVGQDDQSQAEDIKLNTGSEVLTLKATTSLFPRMLVIARSSRQSVDLE